VVNFLEGAKQESHRRIGDEKGRHCIDRNDGRRWSSVGGRTKWQPAFSGTGKNDWKRWSTNDRYESEGERTGTGLEGGHWNFKTKEDRGGRPQRGGRGKLGKNQQWGGNWEEESLEKIR